MNECGYYSIVMHLIFICQCLCSILVSYLFWLVLLFFVVFYFEYVKHYYGSLGQRYTHTHTHTHTHTKVHASLCMQRNIILSCPCYCVPTSHNSLLPVLIGNSLFSFLVYPPSIWFAQMNRYICFFLFSFS